MALLELSLSVYSNAYVELISLRLFLGGMGFYWSKRFGGIYGELYELLYSDHFTEMDVLIGFTKFVLIAYNSTVHQK